MFVGRYELSPRHNANQRKIYCDVDQSNRNDADDYGAWDSSTGVSHFVTEIADIVIA
jgi:hypothetical protein